MRRQSLGFGQSNKRSLFADDLRDREHGKIECGRAHFEALAAEDNPARYVVARSADDVWTQAAPAGAAGG